MRPAWQAYPAGPPVVFGATCWCAFQISSRSTLGFTEFIEQPSADDNLGNTLSIRQQLLNILCSFYDESAEGQADNYASIFADGLFVPQNNELLEINGFGFIGVGDAVPVPILLKERWYYRTDISVTLQRYVARNYAVRTLLGANANVKDPHISSNINTVL